MLRIFAAIAVLTAATVASADTGAGGEPPAQTAPAWLVAPTDPELTPLRHPSYFEQHAMRVERDMLIFEHGYTLERMRERDQLELYGTTPGTTRSSALGVGLFSVAVVSSAHTPPFLRFAFDRSFHVGPAIFDGGGMGAGVGGIVW